MEDHGSADDTRDIAVGWGGADGERKTDGRKDASGRGVAGSGRTMDKENSESDIAGEFVRTGATGVGETRYQTADCPAAV